MACRRSIGWLGDPALAVGSPGLSARSARGGGRGKACRRAATHPDRQRRHRLTRALDRCRPATRDTWRHFTTWNRAVRRAGLKPLGPDVHPWSDDEVIGALQRWAARHGRAPRWEEWMRAGPGRPSKTTVVTHFGGWRAALAVAGLDWRPWSNDALIRSLQGWTEEHGCPPKAHEWDRAGPGRPSKTAVCLRFGSWRAGLAAAGLDSTPRRRSRRTV